jgi:hypothetical protein
MRALAKFARLDVLEAHTRWDDTGDPGSDFWHDSVLVAQKPCRSWAKSLGVRCLQAVQLSSMSYRLA